MSKASKNKKDLKEMSKHEEYRLSVKENKTKAVFRGYLRFLQRPGASIRDIWETERIGKEDDAPYIRDVITLSGFSQRAGKGEWRKRRQEHWLEVRSNVMEHLQTQAVKSEIAEIEELEALKVATMGTITGDASIGLEPAKARSFEGSVNAFIALDKRISSKRVYVTEQTAAASQRERRENSPSVSGAALTSLGVTIGGEALSEDDVSAMARALAASKAGLELEENSEDERITNHLTPSDFPKEEKGTGIKDEGTEGEEEANGKTVRRNDDPVGKRVSGTLGGEDTTTAEALVSGDKV